MNKKLFALLTSAALMAGFVPSVFAEAGTDRDMSGVDAGLKIVAADAPDEEGNVAFDVYVVATDGGHDYQVDITSVQFDFVVTGGDVVVDVQNVRDPHWATSGPKRLLDQGFKFDQNCETVFMWDFLMYQPGVTPEVAALDMSVDGGVPEEGGTKIGTVRVKPDEDAEEVTVGYENFEIKILVPVLDADGDPLYSYDDPEYPQGVPVCDYFTAPTGTYGDQTVGVYTPATEDSSSDVSSDAESSSEAPVSSATESTASSANDSVVSSAAESNVDSGSSSAASSSSSAASSSSSRASSSSSKATNGTNANTNTGAASTVAVALAASAAALVVISKKRK